MNFHTTWKNKNSTSCSTLNSTNQYKTVREATIQDGKVSYWVSEQKSWRNKFQYANVNTVHNPSSRTGNTKLHSTQVTQYYQADVLLVLQYSQRLRVVCYCRVLSPLFLKVTVVCYLTQTYRTTLWHLSGITILHILKSTVSKLNTLWYYPHSFTHFHSFNSMRNYFAMFRNAAM